MKNIYYELLELAASGASAILVTVVKKEGAGPAETGSKMIVYGDGRISGTVGGGSIENLAIEKARELMIKKMNALQKYDMDNGESGEETGMLCGGSATLFFEYSGTGTACLYLWRRTYRKGACLSSAPHELSCNGHR
ncbi:MAG: XdhC family protein [Candidatus Marinimicrobia bacterium]|nr:XdhC family protein [Candidatus Neomarinimicrobiota bacterium]